VLTPVRRANSEECIGRVAETLVLTGMSSGVERVPGSSDFRSRQMTLSFYSRRQ
jgi:hypothetical protein